MTHMGLFVLAHGVSVVSRLYSFISQLLIHFINQLKIL
jgi:hypothetical protein